MKIPAANLKGTPYEQVRFQFVDVTPELAMEWLKSNKKNRKLKEATVEGYVMDMRNEAWLPTHQGLAFDRDDNLIDGQHRLESIVRSGKTVRTVVSSGWPSEADKRKTMDAVDRGAGRTLADQLHLQHGIEQRDAPRVVQICNVLAAMAMNQTKVRKSTTDSILAIFGLYQAELNWVMSHPLKKHGFGNAQIGGCLAILRSLWPKIADEFVSRLMTGENLNRENSLLHLRNWLLSASSTDSREEMRLAFFHHAADFMNNRPCKSLVMNSEKAFLQAMKLSAVRVEKVRKIYHDIQQASAPKIIAPLSAEGIAIGEKLSPVFTSTDATVQIGDAGDAGQWLLNWMNSKWIESAGLGQYRKTERFGRI